MRSRRAALLAIVALAFSLRGDPGFEALPRKITRTPPASLYELAERCYAAGEFEIALCFSRAALLLSPRHAPARALRTEVEFILGIGKAAPAQDYGRFMRNCMPIRTDGLAPEIDDALERAEGFGEDSEPELAARERRRALELDKGIVPGDDLRARLNWARNTPGSLPY